MNLQSLPENLKSLPNSFLLEQTERLAAEERRITTQVLWHLYEIERRMLFAEMGFSSLFDYCTQILKYSAASAHRRIASMRLLKQMPEIESKIDSGELNITALSQAQTVFRQAKIENKAFTLEAKKELIQKLESKSSRDCEKIIAELNPVDHRVSKERVIAGNRTEIRFEASDALYEKIKKLQGKYAHKLKGSNDFADLLEILMDSELNQSVSAPEVNSTAAGTSSRYIPKAIKKKALEEAAGVCTWVDPISQRKCASSFALQFDHIELLALGGRTEAENIRVLCRTHNRYSAVQALGVEKMEKYVD